MHPPAPDATTRFSNRVADYVRGRPGYPPALLLCLQRDFALSTQHEIVDVGSGTGLSAAVFLANGNPVIGVEPNDDMRRAGDDSLAARYPGFRSVRGTAEETSLPAASADWIVCAQAFHWFDVAAARTEFRRILRPGGHVALIWNNRREDTPFLHGLESLILRHATDYAAVKHQQARTDGRIERFYQGRMSHRAFDNEQRFDYDGLLTRVSSSSYLPSRDDGGFAAMEADLRRLFEQHVEQDGRVAILYETELFVGRLD
ncbi:MAG: class I SAM-dependent methyltransferase [Planctomycetia bacterium]|nr:MAG: class I SAM-dependent methyltransferase [Planctomycetia bacterium]